MSTGAETVLTTLISRLEASGLLLRGGFHPEPQDGAPPGCQTLVLIGNAGSDMWTAYSNDVAENSSTLDVWTKAQLGPLAEELGATAHYYFEGPPYWPFLTWARRAQDLNPSPLGMLLDPEYGLWHAYRAVFAFSEKFVLPEVAQIADICRECVEKPCLNTCPVKAFSGSAYDVPSCATYLRSAEGNSCMTYGCMARQACPVGAASRYDPAHAAFHMRAFLDAH